MTWIPYPRCYCGRPVKQPGSIWCGEHTDETDRPPEVTLLPSDPHKGCTGCGAPSSACVQMDPYLDRRCQGCATSDDEVQRRGAAS